MLLGITPRLGPKCALIHDLSPAQAHPEPLPHLLFLSSLLLPYLISTPYLFFPTFLKSEGTDKRWDHSDPLISCSLCAIALVAFFSLGSSILKGISDF